MLLQGRGGLDGWHACLTARRERGGAGRACVRASTGPAMGGVLPVAAALAVRRPPGAAHPGARSGDTGPVHGAGAQCGPGRATVRRGAAAWLVVDCAGEDALTRLQGASIRYRIAVRPIAARKTLRLHTPGVTLELAVLVGGSSRRLAGSRKRGGGHDDREGVGAHRYLWRRDLV